MNRFGVFVFCLVLLGLREASGAADRNPESGDGVFFTPRASSIATEDGEATAPQGLLSAEKDNLQTTNHALGDKEFSTSVKYSVPFSGPNFTFNQEDWSVFRLPNSGEEMIVTNSAEPQKELILSLHLPLSKIIISYQFNMTYEHHKSHHPSLEVYFFEEGTRTLLKNETAQETWSNSSIELMVEHDSELLFVATLSDAKNEIAIRSLFLEDLSPHPIRYGQSESSPNYPTSPKAQPTSVQHSVEVSPSGKSSVQPVTTFHKTTERTNGHGTSQSWDIPTTAAYNPIVPTPEAEDDASSAGSTTLPSGSESKSENSSALYDDQTTFVVSESSGSTSSFSTAIFFLIGMSLGGLLVFAFIKWYRRKEMYDDEIPVFVNTSAMHENPTFGNDENIESGLNAAPTSNYRSIQ